MLQTVDSTGSEWPGEGAATSSHPATDQEVADQKPLSLPSSLQSAQEWAERAEALEKGNNRGASSKNIRKELEKAYGKVNAYLQRNPNDVPSLLLAARLGRSLEVRRPIELRFGPGTNLEQVARELRDQTDRLQSFCDRALAVDPNNAEAHYWKARLYGVRGLAIHEGKSTFGPVDLEGAIRFARHAVELAPQNASYREELALYLFDDDRRSEAIEVMREASGGQHPIYLLLKEREAIPLPPGSALLRERTERSISEMVGAGWPVNYPFLRYYLFVLPMTAADVETFWRSTWPGFQLFRNKEEQFSGGLAIHYFQWMRWQGNGVSPAKERREIPGGPDSDLPEGVLLLVSEFRNMKDHETFPVPVGDVFCVLLIRNYRPSGTR